MSENRPSLNLPPRDPSKVRNLLRSNRPVVVPDVPEVQEAPADQPTARSRRVQVTFYMDSDARDRARAAYRATSVLEGDESWSDFIELAVLNEVARRERLHNDGERYEGGSRRLKPGRKIAD